MLGHDCLMLTVFTFVFCVHSETRGFLAETCAYENIIGGLMMDVIMDNFCVRLEHSWCVMFYSSPGVDGIKF